jgi:enediyne biosynthesis protein E4
MVRYVFRSCILINLMLLKAMRSKRTVLLLFLFLNISWFGYPQAGKKPLFEKIIPKTSGIKFKNTLRETETQNMLSFINFYTGAGVGILDINNDGLQDIFFGGNQVSSRLYQNKGSFRFEDITEKSGIKTNRWITGVSIVDINQDGFDDIYLSVSGTGNTENLLYVNNKNNTFTERSVSYNLNIKDQTTHTSFFDYDHDGDLDAFLATNPTDFKLNSAEILQRPKRNGESRGTDILLRNEGNNKFKDVSGLSGILIEGYSLGLNTSDFNQDGWADIYVSNDYIGNDILYINNRDGTFSDRLNDFFDYTSFASMGNDAGDINNDGLTDLITLDMLPESSVRQKVIVGSPNYKSFIYALGLGYSPQYSRNMLQLNNGNNTFSEIGRLAGIFRTDWSWAPLLTDLDNDGFKDLCITTGFRRDMGNLDFIYMTDESPFKKGGDPVPVSMQLEAIRQFDGVPVANYLFKNNRNLTFTNVSQEWGFDEKTYSIGLAIADLDNDGDFDIIINNLDDYASVYKNNSNDSKTHFIKIKFQGSKNNLSGIGAKVKIFYGGNLQFEENNPYRGFMSSVEKNLLFGIGKYDRLDSIVVVWPDGQKTVRYNQEADTTIIVQYHQTQNLNSNRTMPVEKTSFFNEIASKIGITYKHKEDEYIDFFDQPLLPHHTSQMGPAIAIGDINNDGLDDFFIGGSRGYPAKLFFQNSKGSFRSQDFPFDLEFEDMGALLFDLDKDKDLDLYVVSGGTFGGKNSALYQDRLYINTGNGKFIKSENIIPEEYSSGSVVTAADFDKDGDLDLFVGGRILPLNYPYPPGSFLLENRDGRFYDVTSIKAPGLSDIGMVNSALWTDFNDDGNIDLLILGEWMPVTIFQNIDGKLINRTLKYGLENTSGWWTSISSVGSSKNGRLNYVLGNIGLNEPYNVTFNDPLKIVSKDFDNDGKTEPLLIMKYVDGYFPVPSRSQFLSLFPQKIRKYKSFETYARTNADELLKDLGSDGALEYSARMFANCMLFNEKDSLPILKPLPNEAQFAPILGTQIFDYNGDRRPDILFAGNYYSANVIDGPYSASTGGIIYMDSLNNITVKRGHENGFNVSAEARAVASLILGNKKQVFIVTNNSDSIKVFSPLVQKEKHIRLQSMDASAIIEWNDGLKQKQEFYYGSGFLSQSSRYLSVRPGWKKITIVTYSGDKRIITPEDISAKILVK